MVVVRYLMFVLCLLLMGCNRGAQEETFEYTTGELKLEPGQTSMAGTEDRRWIRLVDGAELIWITGYEVEVLDAATEENKPLEFLCHASLDVAPDKYRQSLGSSLNASGRLFTLSQGVTKVRFPKGFALPFHTRNPLALQAQVLNLNDRTEPAVRHRVRVNFLRDSQVKKRPKALFLVRAPVLKSQNPEGATFGEAIGESACTAGLNANPTGYIETDSEGEVFFSHWKLGQGREECKTLITDRLNLQHDVTCHYIISHVHPTAESLELMNLTAMEPLYRCEVENTGNGLGIRSLPIYSSSEGFTLSPETNYGLVSVYDNKSGRELDAMAVMYLYVHDPKYRPPSRIELELPLPPGAELAERTAERVLFEVNLPVDMLRAYFQDALAEPWIVDGPDMWRRDDGTLKIREGTSSRQSILVIEPATQ